MMRTDAEFGQRKKKHPTCLASLRRRNGRYRVAAGMPPRWLACVLIAAVAVAAAARGSAAALASGRGPAGERGDTTGRLGPTLAGWRPPPRVKLFPTRPRAAARATGAHARRADVAGVAADAPGFLDGEPVFVHETTANASLDAQPGRRRRATAYGPFVYPASDPPVMHGVTVRLLHRQREVAAACRAACRRVKPGPCTTHAPSRAPADLPDLLWHVDDQQRAHHYTDGAAEDVAVTLVQQPNDVALLAAPW